MTRADSRISFTLPPELKAELQRRASAHKRSLSQELFLAVRLYLGMDDDAHLCEVLRKVIREELSAVRETA